MTRYVYIDVLFLANWLMNFLILWATAVFCEARASARRLVLAGALGAVYSVAVEVSRAEWTRVPQVKVVVLVLMVVLGLRPRTLMSGARCVTCFLTFCFSVAGAAFAIGYLAGAPASEPGSAAILGGAALASLGVQTIISRARRQSLMPGTYDTAVTVEARTAKFESYLDTGNHLRDPLSGWPVVVAERGAVEPVIPEDVRRALDALAAGDDCYLQQLNGEEWSGRMRVIPYDSLGRRNGMLLGFRPDKLELCCGGKWLSTSRVVLAVYDRPLSADGTYRALVGPEVMGLGAKER